MLGMDALFFLCVFSPVLVMGGLCIKPMYWTRLIGLAVCIDFVDCVFQRSSLLPFIGSSSTSKIETSLSRYGSIVYL